MKIVVDMIDTTEEEAVTFHVYQVDQKTKKVISYVENATTYLLGNIDSRTYKVHYDDILYIETVDKKSFVYTLATVYEIPERLYQLEEKLQPVDCIRVSKSMILNIDKIKAVAPTISGRFEAELQNGEKVLISRSYVPNLKNKLGMGRAK